MSTAVNGRQSVDDPRVTVVLLNYNAWPDTLRCHEIASASERVELDFLLVDNGSRDGSTERLAERVGEDRVIALPENTGYVGGMNAGLRAWSERADTEYVLLLTTDALVDPNTVRRLVDVLERDANVGIAGPLVIYRREPPLLGAGGRVHVRRTRVAQDRAVRGTAPYTVDWVDGCCMLLRRETVTAVGMLDPRYFIYFEETDLCHRTVRAGWSVVLVPDVAVDHNKEALPAPTYFYYMVRNRYLFWRKNFGRGFLLVAGSVAWDTARAAASAVRALIVPSRWKTIGYSWRLLLFQMRGVVLGTRDHLRGRYGQAPDRRRPASLGRVARRTDGVTTGLAG